MYWLRILGRPTASEERPLLGTGLRGPKSLPATQHLFSIRYPEFAVCHGSVSSMDVTQLNIIGPADYLKPTSVSTAATSNLAIPANSIFMAFMLRSYRS